MRLAERAASQRVRQETRTQACTVAVAGEGARRARQNRSVGTENAGASNKRSCECERRCQLLPLPKKLVPVASDVLEYSFPYFFIGLIVECLLYGEGREPKERGVNLGVRSASVPAV